MIVRWVTVGSSGALFALAVGVIASARASIFDFARSGLPTSIDAARALIHAHMIAGALSLAAALLLGVASMDARRRSSSGQTPFSIIAVASFSALTGAMGVAAIAYGQIIGAALDSLPWVGSHPLLRELRTHLATAHEIVSCARFSVPLLCAFVGSLALRRSAPRPATRRELVTALLVLAAGIAAFALTRAHRADSLDPPHLVSMPEPARRAPLAAAPLFERCTSLRSLRGEPWTAARESRSLPAAPRAVMRPARGLACDFMSVGATIRFESRETSARELPELMRDAERNRAVLGIPSDGIIIEATADPSALTEPLAIARRSYAQFFLLGAHRRIVPTNTLGDWTVLESCAVRIEVATERGHDLREFPTVQALAARAESGGLVVRVAP